MKHVKFVKRVTFFFGLTFLPPRTREKQAESLQRNLFICKWLYLTSPLCQAADTFGVVALEGARERCPGGDSLTVTYGQATGAADMQSFCYALYGHTACRPFQVRL